jgi:hypothetical protein
MESTFQVPLPRLEPALLRQGRKTKTFHGKQCTHPKRETVDETVCPY